MRPNNNPLGRCPKGHGKTDIWRYCPTSPKNWNKTRPGLPTFICPPTDYPPARGVPCKSITAIIRTGRSCPRCHFNKPDELLRLKFHKEAGWPDLAKHGYFCKKDVTEAATIVCRFNSQFPKAQPCVTRSTGACRAIEDAGSEDTVSARWVHSPSIPSTIPVVITLPDHLVTPSAPPAPYMAHLQNKVDPPSSSNGFTDLKL